MQALDNAQQPMATPDGVPKRKRRNLFDVGPGGQDAKTVVDDQPILADEKGQLLNGPGAGGLQPRSSEAKIILPAVNKSQEEVIAKAKRYAMEQSVQHVLAKQKAVQIEQMTSVQTSAQRQRALALMCRIYVGSINFELKEDTIRTSFTPFGPIKKIDMSWDPAMMKHKGFAFVEYDLPEAAQLSLEQMNGVLLGGRNIKVGRPSNVPQAAPWIEQILEEARQYARIYIASIHSDLGETDIQSVFEAFGKIKACQLAPDVVSGKHKGYGFIEYDTQQSANDAISSMNLFDLGGQYLRVGRAITPPANGSSGPLPAAAALAAAAVSAKIQAQDVATALGGISSMGATGIPQMATAVIPSVGAVPVAIPTMIAANPLLSAQTAALNPLASVNPAAIPSMMPSAIASSAGALMQTSIPQSTTATISSMPPPLSSPAPPTSASVPAPPPGPTKAQLADQLNELQAKVNEQNLSNEENIEISGSNARYMIMQKLSRKNTSNVIVLKNMVTIDEVDEDLQTEVTEECSRFGEVTKVVIYQEAQGEEDGAEVIVKIYVEFLTVEEAEKAQDALNGRWFGGKCIIAELYDEAKFKTGDLAG